MKKRQHLPLMAKLNFKIDIERFKNEFYDFGYDNWTLYDGLKQGLGQTEGLITRRILLEYFLNDRELEEQKGQLIAEGGEAYKMMCLTKYNTNKFTGKEYLNPETLLDKFEVHDLARKLEKICDPNDPLYIPEADEKNYDIRNEFCKGYLNDVMDLIETNVGHVTRSRFAVLMPGEQIKPHIDINTDKAIRIHIPLITNEDCVVGVKGKKTVYEEHLPADGSVWFLNQGYTHWVKNNGSTPRVHFIASVVGQDSIEESHEKWNDSMSYA
jgi:hypothetical protein